MLACRRVICLLMFRKVEGKLGRIRCIGMEAQAAYRAGIFAGPYAFAFPAGHYRAEADFFI